MFYSFTRIHLDLILRWEIDEMFSMLSSAGSAIFELIFHLADEGFPTRVAGTLISKSTLVNWSAVAQVMVDFEGRVPTETDSHGIRQLLLPLLPRAHVNWGDLADIVISQNYVGSVLKVSKVQQLAVSRSSPGFDKYRLVTVAKKCDEEAAFGTIFKRTICMPFPTFTNIVISIIFVVGLRVGYLHLRGYCPAMRGGGPGSGHR